MAAGVLLRIAQDENVRPGLRIHAARTVLLGATAEVYYDDPVDTPETAASDAQEDAIEEIANRVAAKLRETT